MNYEEELKKGCGKEADGSFPAKCGEEWSAMGEKCYCAVCKAKLEGYQKAKEEDKNIRDYVRGFADGTTKQIEICKEIIQKAKEEDKKKIEKLKENILFQMKINRDIKKGVFKRVPNEEYEKEIKKSQKDNFIMMIDDIDIELFFTDIKDKKGNKFELSDEIMKIIGLWWEQTSKELKEKLEKEE